MFYEQVLRVLCISAMVLSANWLTTPAFAVTSEEQANAKLATEFYQRVWFSDHPEEAIQYFAPEYIIHEIGGLDGAIEPASMQTDIAGFLWKNGEMGGDIGFQLAQGDLVVTRWHWDYRPTSLLMKLMMTGSRNPIPVINVFRYKDGKIVEVWNHRHDIDVGFQANKIWVKGFLVGVILCVLISLVWRFFRARKRSSAPS